MTPPASRRKINPLWLLIIVLPVLSISAALLIVLDEEGPAASSSTPAITATPYVHPLTGTMAPNFELPALDGSPVRLSSLRGRLVFVNLWATWCEPCRREFPAFEAFSAQQTGAVVLAVSQGDSPGPIQAFLGEVGSHNVRVLLDPDFHVGDLYSADYLPSTFVIDPAGTVAAFHLGEITLDELNHYVRDFGAP